MLLTHWPPQPQQNPLSTLKRKTSSSVMDGLQKKEKKEVVSHGYRGLGGGRDGGGSLYACWTMPGGVGRMSGVAGALPERILKTLMIHNHSTFQVRRSG